jgi:hypothetical protein
MLMLNKLLFKRSSETEAAMWYGDVDGL